MKCYYHQSVDAVALCKNCYRGLCPACAAEVENGIACKNRCEKEVLLLDDLVQKNKRAFKETGKAYKRNSVLYFLLGSFFVVSGYAGRNTGSLGIFFLITGFIFILGAVFNVMNGRRLDK